MATFHVLYEVHPSYAFGIPTADHLVTPELDPTINWKWDSGQLFLTRKDGTSTTRRIDEAVRATVSINGVTIIIDDNRFQVILTESDVDAAIRRATGELDRLLAFFSISLNGPDFLLASQVIGVVQDGVRLKRSPEVWGSFYVYDNNLTSQKFVRSAETLDGLPSDRKLTKSLRYLGLGDALLSLFPANSSPEQNQSIIPLRFLQYWKSLTAIVGDPSNDRDHQVRPRILGLDRHFFRQRVRPMHDIRNKYDVAHVASPDEPRIVSAEEADECRRVAVEAIDAYVAHLRNQNTEKGT